MGCCDNQCDKKVKRRPPFALMVLIGLVVLAVVFWQ